MRLEFRHGVIRDFVELDVPDLVKYANNRNVQRNMFDAFPHPYTKAAALDWLGRLAKMPVATDWAIEVGGHAIGAIGVSLNEGMRLKSAEFGYWLGEPHWGRGIATAAVRALVPRVVDQFGLVRLEAHVFEWNAASMRVLEKAGFLREGVRRKSAFKDGVVVDEVVYGYVVPDAPNRSGLPC